MNVLVAISYMYIFLFGALLSLLIVFFKKNKQFDLECKHVTLLLLFYLLSSLTFPLFFITETLDYIAEGLMFNIVFIVYMIYVFYDKLKQIKSNI